MIDLNRDFRPKEILLTASNYILFGMSLFLQSCGEKKETLFSKIPSSYSGISFSNTLEEGPNTNILMYEYFFNGAGVAVGDFNQDGLEDIYFTSNMAENALYLNKGNLKFQDVTLKSQTAGRQGPWKSGTTIMDINQDGLLDIYVSYSGNLPPEKRMNQLFENQGNNAEGIPIFKENAAKYGLNSTGFSNQAYFFDCDMDGDLDALLLNHNPKNLPILSPAGTQELLAQDSPEMGLRLLKQKNGKFEDVTLESGINGSPLSYGLGLAIADINGDHWPDFYVSNDYTVPDYLYINQKNGTFKNELKESLGHTSQFSMGNNIADINNDALMDIFTLDMLPEGNKRQKLLLAPDNYGKFDLNVNNGFYYQYMRNMLHMNNGDGTFSEIGQLAGISNTDWSWAPLFADFNNDTYKDLYVSNGYLRDYTNMDFIKYMDDFVTAKGRLQREDVLELISNMPSSEVSNYSFQNILGESFRDTSEEWGISEPSNSTGAAYADFDNDGDLDLVINNINKEAFLYKNNSQGNYIQFKLKGPEANKSALGATVSVFHNGMQQVNQSQPTLGYLSSVTEKIHFGLGEFTNIDSVVVIWPNLQRQLFTNLSINRLHSLHFDASKTLKFTAKSKEEKALFSKIGSLNHPMELPKNRDFDRQLLLYSEISTKGSILAKADVNMDGLEDLFVGATKGTKAALYLQQKNGEMLKSPNQFQTNQEVVDAAAAFGDLDMDGDLDLYLARGGYHDFTENDVRLCDQIYLNNGNGIFEYYSTMPEKVASTTVTMEDLDGDGDLDLFVGSGPIPGKYPLSGLSRILINKGKANFEIQEINLGKVVAASWIKKDNLKKLVVLSEWYAPKIFTFQNGKLIEDTTNPLQKAGTGLWRSMLCEDLNKDGIVDFIFGNFGLNTQLRASKEKPLKLYYGDLDGNKSVDPILSFYFKDTEYPYLTKEELGLQIPSFNSTFPSFESFAETTTAQLLSGFDFNVLSVSSLQTTLLLSNASGDYTFGTLPREVNFSPVNTILSSDVNADGFLDILLLGNDYHTSLKLGKIDANFGTILLNQKGSSFEFLPFSKTALKTRFQVNDAVILDKYLWIRTSTAGIIGYNINLRQ